MQPFGSSAPPKPIANHAQKFHELIHQVDMSASASVVDAFNALDALRLMTEVESPWELHARVLLNQSVIGACGGVADVATIVPLLREVLHLYSSMGHHTHVIHVQCLLGSVYSQIGKTSYADQCFLAALKALDALGNAPVEQAAAGLVGVEPIDISIPHTAYAKHLCHVGDYSSAIARLQPLLQADKHMFSTASRCEMVLTTAKALKALQRHNEAIELLRSEVSSLTEGYLCIAATTTSSTAATTDSSANLWRVRFYSHRPVAELLARVFAEIAGHLHYNGATKESVQSENVAEAIKLYEGAAELSLNCTREAVRVYGKQNVTHPAVRSVIKLHAEILFNAGTCVAFYTSDRDRAASAVGILEESVKLLVRAQYDHLTPRVRLQYAKVLRQVGLLDEALTQYLRTLEIVGQPNFSSRVSSGGEEMIGQHFEKAPRTVTISEVHAHLAHCLHFSVGDFVRAHDHYLTALKTCHHPEVMAVVESWASAHGRKVERGTLHDCAAYQAALEAEPRLRADTLSWLLESCADCLRRLQHPEKSLVLLNMRLAIGRSVGDVCVSALVALSSILEAMPERAADAKKVFDTMIALPQDAMTTLERLDLVGRYATFANYTLQDFAKAAELYTLALELDSLNPMLLAQLAWCARQLPTESQPSVDQLTAIYVKALAAIEIFKSDAELQRGTSSQRSASAHGDSQPTRRFWTPQFDEFFVVSEAARFYHEVARDNVKAELLYLRAMNLSSTAPPSALAHVLANYAILKFYAMGDKSAAESLFRKALAINPANFVVSNLFADFLISCSTTAGDGDESAALQHIRQMIELFPDQSAAIYHKLARVEERSGNMGDEESRAGALVSYMIAASGDRELEASALSDDKVVSILSRCTDVNLVKSAIGFIQVHLKALPLANECSAAVYPRLRQHPLFLINYSRICVDLGNMTLASQLLSEAYALHPLDPIVTEHYADFIASVDRNQALAAERLHLSCLQLHAHDAAAHLAYAVFLTVHLPSPVVATKHFKLAIELHPTDANTWSQYASFAERQAAAVGAAAKGYADIIFEAEKAFNKSRELSNDSPAALLASGLFYMRTKRSSEAWSCLKAAYEKAPNNHAIVSSCAIFLHDRHNALASQRQPLSSAPSDGLSEAKQLSELSDKLYQKAIKMDSNDAHVVTQYAKFVEEVLLLPGEARRWYEHAEGIARRKRLQESTAANQRPDGDTGKK